MKIPDDKECFEIIKDMNMMQHIILHSMKVQKVAIFMCSQLIKIEPKLNTDLIKASALLHDITKTRSFTTGEQHAQTGGSLLSELGYKEVGNIVKQHVILDNYNFEGDLREEEIVNYSDKRVLHDQVVPLEKRLEYILDKYANTKSFYNRIQKAWKNTEKLEKKLFKKLNIEPDYLGIDLK